MAEQGEIALKFRVRNLDMPTKEKRDTDFENVLDALVHIGKTWDLNKHLMALTCYGYTITLDPKRCVMLLGVYPNGTEELICSGLISAQLGGPVFPTFTFSGVNHGATANPATDGHESV